MFNKLLKHKKEVLAILLVVIVSAIPHSVNMFGYPYYENDEGTYMSQAWSFLTEGRLAPYTYWYDHAPLGWLLIALWSKLTGGFFTFGMSVNSGRVLMLLLHVISGLLIYFIAKRLTGSKVTGLIAVTVFSLTPLGIYFQRRVLLDNMMVFWFLAAWAILMKKKVTLKEAIISGVFFGLSVLTKENAIFFFPGFIYLIVLRYKKSHLQFALIQFVFVSFSIVSTYFLYAFLKKELFPQGFLGEQNPHVSLFSTLSYHSSRGNGLPFWNTGSDFYISLDYWLLKDKYLLYFGVVGTYITFLATVKNKLIRIPFLFTILFIFFLLRGGLIINFYILPLIPLFALNLGIATYAVCELLTKKLKILVIPCSLLLTGTYLYSIATRDTSHWRWDQTKPQIEAFEWVKENVPSDAYIVMDCYPYVDMHEARFPGDKVFKNSDWFWKFWYDPEIKEKFGNDWQNVDYILVTHEMLRQMEYRIEKDDPLRLAYLNSNQKLLRGPTGNTYLDTENFKSTDGDWAGVYEMGSPEDLVLNTSWLFYKNKFIKSYGQVVDPAGERTTSEGQSYAMLRALYANDRKTFDGVWSWTRDHMKRREDNLISWLWAKDEKGNFGVRDANSAADGDEDIALSLVFAYKKWNEPRYLFDAIPILNDIWQKEVVNINGNYVLGFSADPLRDGGVVVNPSYFSPGSYRIFSKVDTTHPWEQLATDSYELLNQIANEYSSPLPPNWIYIDKNGVISSAKKWIGDDADLYGFDAFRTYFRIALDARWFNSQDAQNYLSGPEPFFKTVLKDRNNVSAKYTLDRHDVAGFSAISTSTAPVVVMASKNSPEKEEVFLKLLGNRFDKDGGYWGDMNNYYDQNWAWLATAFFEDKIKNYWLN